MTIDTLKQHEFSLVLSGGGALGIAHLGVLHDLEHHDLTPSEIVGTSMGGIVGACLAIGMKEVEIYALIQRFSGLFNWIKFSFSGHAVIQNERIAGIFHQVFGNRMMHETHIPLKLIATNLLSGEVRIFSAKDETITITDALLATMAIPGIFEAHTIESIPYGDGFLCENLGLAEVTYEYVLAIDVLGKHSFESALPGNRLKSANVLEMFEKSMRLLIYNQTQSAIRHSTKKIWLIEPETKAYKTFHFHKAEVIRTLGLGLLEISKD